MIISIIINYYFLLLLLLLLFLSLLLPFCIIILERDLVNILFPYFSNFQSNQPESFTTQQIDIEINILRSQLMSFSSIISRESSVYSNNFSMAYTDRIQVLANNYTWTKKVESIQLQSLSLSYTTITLFALTTRELLSLLTKLLYL